MTEDDLPLPFPFDGPDALRTPVLSALNGVVDPELALNIVDVGLVYGVSVSDERWLVHLTMTSAACPVTDVIVEEVEDALDRIAPPDARIEVVLVWDPPWSSDRLSERAKAFMGW